MSHVDDLVQQILTLSPNDRAYVIATVEERLAIDGFANAEIASAWAAEAERRANAYERGETGSMPVGEALADLRAKLALRKVIP